MHKRRAEQYLDDIVVASRPGPLYRPQECEDCRGSGVGARVVGGAWWRAAAPGRWSSHRASPSSNGDGRMTKDVASQAVVSLKESREDSGICVVGWAPSINQASSQAKVRASRQPRKPVSIWLERTEMKRPAPRTRPFF
jgi:hypothetical protein